MITGGAAGLGLAAAKRLIQEGADLLLVDLNADALEAAKAEVQAEGDSRVETFVANVANEDEVKAYVAKAVELFGKIDGFFNNAGIEGKQNLTESYGADEFHRVVAINLNGVFYGMAEVLRVMATKETGGHIVNTASVGGILGVGNQSGYSASKHGVVGLTRNSAREYGTKNITINAIALGAIMTAMVEGSLKQMDPENWEEAGQAFVSSNPTCRFGKPEEVAATVAFLLSDDAGFINGSILPIDGGQHGMY
ncbi:MAG: SDR family oxidoreductase [Actinomycetaceae bacterium]|nr:SDR family oxidoreductase [Actinomycetaceae bacterium]